MHTKTRQGQFVASLVRSVLPLRAPVAAAAARVVPYDAAVPRPHVICSKLGLLESAIVDTRGRLFVTSQTWSGPILRGAVLRLDHPEAEAVPLTEDIPSPGGLTFDEQGQLIVGYGDNAVGGLLGNFVGRAGLLRVDPDTGTQQTYATGLSMANGIARAADGTIFASDDVGTHLDRVDPDGTVHRRWARIWSANGLAIDPTGHYLYAAQFFPPAAIRRIDITDPTKVTTHAQPQLPGRFALLDGMAIDARGRLYVAANGAGQIWRVDTDGTIRALARGLAFPSAVALGRGPDGFSAGNLYAVTFSGDIVALPAAAE